MFNKIFKKLGRGFILNVITLSSGNLVAALILLIFSPIILRIYSPDDLGAYQVFIALSSYFVLVSCLRFEYSLLSKKVNLFTTFKINLLCFSSIIFVTIISILYCFLCVAFKFDIYLSIGNIIFFLPLLTFFGGLVMLYTINGIKTKKFGLLSKSKILQNSSLTFTQISLGLINFSNLGLFYADIIGKASFSILNFDKRYFKIILSFFKISTVIKIAFRFKSFPLLMLPSKIFNLTATSLPIIIIGNSYSLGVVGFYYLIDRIFAPISILVSEAVSRVFESDLSLEQSQDTNLFKKSLYIILCSFIILIPFVLIIPYVERIVVFCFGSNWIGSYEYYVVLLPMFMSGIISNTLTNTLLILEEHKKQFIWDLLRAVVVVSMIYYSVNINNTHLQTLSILSVSLTFFYIIHIILSLTVIKKLS